MFIRKIVLPVNATDEAGAIADIFNTFGVSQESTEPTQTEPESEVDDTTAPVNETSSETEPTELKEPTTPVVNDKTSNAFAQMRVENKKYQSMIKDVASLLGVNSKNPEEVFSALQEKVVHAQAKQQGISPEIAQRLATLEQQNAEYAKLEARKNAYIGFQNVKDTFGLNDNSLNDFADTLVAEGLNPFEQQVDIMTEYKVRNFDRLMKLAEERGAKAEAERAARATKTGSAPDSRRGKETGEDEKITNISDLSRWLDKFK